MILDLLQQFCLCQKGPNVVKKTHPADDYLTGHGVVLAYIGASYALATELVKSLQFIISAKAFEVNLIHRLSLGS